MLVDTFIRIVIEGGTSNPNPRFQSRRVVEYHIWINNLNQNALTKLDTYPQYTRSMALGYHSVVSFVKSTAENSFESLLLVLRTISSF